MTPASKLIDVRVADVYKGMDTAGTLERETDGSVTFRYDPRYIDAEGSPIATSLPFETPVVRAGAGALPAFFTNLLPEGVRLLALKDRTRTSLSDEMTLLLAVGRDCVGDVCVVPRGEDPDLPAPEESGFDVDRLFARAVAGRDPSALAGVQEKVSSSMLTVPTRTDGPAILKLAPPEFPNLLENEAFFLSAARESGLAAASARLIEDPHGKKALRVERFDRIWRSGAWTKLAQEDGCQLTNTYPAGKYGLTVRHIAEAIGREAAAPAAALDDFLGQLAFAWLIGNGDLHAKNFSLGGPPGELRATPAYDVLSTLPYKQLDPRMALKMDGRDARLKGSHFTAFFVRHGLPARAVARRIERILARMPRWIDRLGEIGYDAQTTDRLRAEILRRAEDLKS